ncbi:hypothetical protein [Pseudolysinimonas sp.]|uniref:hypothetical protein n=1 Tax=Pseudolysinimonas sp. TaxID=2680009 RepID=UPI003F7D7CC6
MPYAFADWHEANDRTLWHETDDPRMVAVVTLDPEPSAPDYDATAPTLIGYEWGTRANFTAIGWAQPVPVGADTIQDAWQRARAEHPYGVTRTVDAEEYADRFVRIFHGATVHHLRSTVDQYTWAVVFDTPEWREAMGIDRDATLDRDNLTADVQAYLDGDVYGIGWAVNDARVDDETDIPDDLSGWDETIECWGFYGQEYAAESALAFEYGRPTLHPLMAGTAPA